jgi:hypothetical protein
LEIIWKKVSAFLTLVHSAYPDARVKFPGIYTAANSIHIDDLSRNFALKFVDPES